MNYDDKEIQQSAWIDAWLAGTLTETERYAFEQERANNPDFAAQCLLAAALHQQGIRQRESDFKKQLRQWQQEAEQETPAKAGAVVSDTTVTETNKQSGNKTAQMKEESATDVSEKTIPIQPLSVWRVRRNWLAAAASVAALFAAMFYLQQPDYEALSTEYLPKAPFRKNFYYQSGSKGYSDLSNEQVLDSLMQYRLHDGVRKMYAQKDTAIYTYHERLYVAVALLQSGKTEDATKAVLLLKSIEAADDKFTNSSLMVKTHLALAYLKTNEADEAKRLLKTVEQSTQNHPEAGEYLRFARELLSKL